MSNLSTFLGGGAASVAKWVSGSSYDLDDIVWSPINYLAYICIVATNGTTDPSADTTNWTLFGASKIKSIQRGTIMLSGANTTATSTVTAVVTGKAELRMLGARAPSSGATDAPEVSVALTNSTTITATRSQTTNAATVSWELTEWW